MTLVSFKKTRRPWFDSMFTDLLGTDRLMTEDLFLDEKWVPAMNIIETKDHYEMELAAPGFDRKDFDVTIENGMLRISAEHKEELKEEEEKFTRREFNYTSFERAMTLPENVNEDEVIDASYTKGILKLVLNKMEVDPVSHKRIIEVH